MTDRDTALELVNRVDRHWARGSRSLTDPLDVFLADTLLRLCQHFPGTPRIAEAALPLVAEGVKISSVTLYLAALNRIDSEDDLDRFLQMDPVVAFIEALRLHDLGCVPAHLEVPEAEPSESRTHAYDRLVSLPLFRGGDARRIKYVPGGKADSPRYTHVLQLRRRQDSVWVVPAPLALLVLACNDKPHMQHDFRQCPCSNPEFRAPRTEPPYYPNWIRDELIPVLLAAYAGVNPDVVEQMAAGLERW